MEWFFVGHPPLPSWKPSVQQQGNCFQVFAQLEAIWFSLTYHSAAHHSLHPLPWGTTWGPWELPSCSASSWRNCTNQRQGVSRSHQGGWASHEATRKRCGKVLLEAEEKQTRKVLSPRCFPWPPRWKNSSPPQDMKQSLTKPFSTSLTSNSLTPLFFCIHNLCMWCFRQGGQCLWGRATILPVGSIEGS